MPPRLDDRIGPNGETREWLILASIRAGGYPHVAAQAYGLSIERFRRWTRRGHMARCVHEAGARARLKAEMETYEADRRFWLRHGPGKETAQVPGWSAPTKHVFNAALDGGNLMSSPEFQNAVVRLLTSLDPMPQAKAVAAAALDEGTTH
jgi:hypothetical protein